VYVDDIILVSSSSTAAYALIFALGVDFAVKDLGQLHFFLGIEVAHQSTGLAFTQKKYSLDLLAHAGTLKCNMSPTPMSSTDKLSAADGAPLSPEDATEYRNIVGGLQYLMITRPDMSFVVNRVCSIFIPLQMCTVLLLNASCVMCVSLCLLIYTCVLGVLSAFSDADLAGCLDDMRSTGDMLCFWVLI
jgi:histone deacetylase 1/2